MDRAAPGYYPGCTSSGPHSSRPYHNEQGSGPPPSMYFQQQPDMQQMYHQQPHNYYPGPNDQYYAWTQQNTMWMQQHQQQQQGGLPPPAGYLPPPPPPPPPAAMGMPSWQYARQLEPQVTPLPPPPNLDAILGASDDEDEKKPKQTKRRLTASDEASFTGIPRVSPRQRASSPPATLSLSSTSTASIPSLLEGLRADVERSDRAAAAAAAAGETTTRSSRSAPDLKAIEHAASILSSRTASSKSSSRRRERESDRSRSSRRRGADERSESRKENRATNGDSSSMSSTRDSKRRTERRREGRDGERERRRSRQRTRSSDATSRRRPESGRAADSSSRSSGTSKRREKQSSKNTAVDAQSSEESMVRPADIQLAVRESAQQEGGVQVYLHSDEEGHEEEEEEGEIGEDEYEEEEGEEEREEEGDGRDSDMDIETEADYNDEVEGPALPPNFHLQHQQTTAPEDEDEHRLTPEVFFASGRSRRVNSPLYREKYKRARALASQALSDEYRERYDLISKMLRARCIFRGLQSTCGPESQRLTIADPRPKSKHVQKFPSKESNVQYFGPDAFTTDGARAGTATAKKTMPGATSAYTFVSRSKLVRAPPPPATAAASPVSLKRTITNASATTMTSSPSTSATQLSIASSSSASDGPTPAKLSKVDEMMANLLSGPSSPAAATRLRPSSADGAPSSPSMMRKVASEANVGAAATAAGKATRSEEAPRPAAATSLPAPAFPSSAMHSPRANATASQPSRLPPRSSLSFRKIGEHVVRPGSKLCFEWAESGGCKAGVFCPFEHGEGAEKEEKHVCSRMLRGLCRGESTCPLPHGLLPHQMPICAHYLRMQCKHGPEECGLVHIKHNEKVPVCVFFNQGKCTKEDDCTFRHQYRSDVIRSLGVHAPVPDTRGQR